ncbi:LOW QUALITY PROTEIN: hypothetical protein PoB_005344200 [Plakobranchus ocellatus]|uniref:Uncharacterized protein n=1 Tax=Plakobranchus ocellatus TaxID=259542 RepID=A0AAV4C5T1_9GAST|nr:LOW QUALITY PROTEIN: hypothetical protein PoB_005344200 [Plakobranchus ocellatus]
MLNGRKSIRQHLSPGGRFLVFSRQRFAPQRPRETTFLSFQNARQKHGESLCDWADRVYDLALGASEIVANAGLTERDIELVLFKLCWTPCLQEAPNVIGSSISEKFQFTHAGMNGPMDSRRPADLHPFPIFSHSGPEYQSRFCKKKTLQESYTSDDNRQEYAPAGTWNRSRATKDMHSSLSKHRGTVSSQSDDMKLLQIFITCFVDGMRKVIAINF